MDKEKEIPTDSRSSVKDQSSSVHVPVLLNEVLENLDPQAGEVIADGTTDGGGHMEAILEKMNFQGKYIAIDLDEKILNETRERLNSKFKIQNSKLNIIWANANYKDLPAIMANEGILKVDKFLLDLGFSSEQLVAGRGFSYRPESVNEPLDMRYNQNIDSTAAQILNSATEEGLANIFWKFGEERFSRRIAKQIVMMRKEHKLITVGDMIQCVKRAVPGYFRKGEMDVIARAFQALRIAVNGELDNLESILKSIPQIASKGGRVAIISFHSLEDRMVKNAFKEIEKAGKAKMVTKKPIAPQEDEVFRNPRSRSAKLRVIEII